MAMELLTIFLWVMLIRCYYDDDDDLNLYSGINNGLMLCVHLNTFSHCWPSPCKGAWTLFLSRRRTPFVCSCSPGPQPLLLHFGSSNVRSWQCAWIS